MKRAVLIGLVLVACKSNEEKAAPVESSKAELVKAAEPTDTVYAASAHVRVVDAKAGQVVKKIDLQRAVRMIAFNRDGSRAYVAASDGVREIDTAKQEVTAKLTDHPARNVEVSDGQIFVLEHDVIVNPDETREILPFRLVTIDAEKRTVVSTEEIGQRILYAHPAAKDRYGVVVFESGEIMRIDPGAKLDSDGTAIDPYFGREHKYRARVREGSLVHEGRAYLPVEAEEARVLEIDLVKGEAAPILLGKPYSLRGIAFSRDGGTLFVNAGIALLGVDMKAKSVAKNVELGGAHTGLSLSADGRFAYLAQTVDGTGGALTAVSLEAFKVSKRIHLDDISPWALAVQPRPELATR